LFPGEDPGPRVQGLVASLDKEIRAYRTTAEPLGPALANPALLIAHPWLGADLGGGTTLLGMLTAPLGPLTEPSLGAIVP